MRRPATGRPTVSFTPPASNGGSADHRLRGDLVAGEHHRERHDEPDPVPGLTNGQSYTFTVTATNGVGTGPASSASAPIVPIQSPRQATPDPPSGAPRPEYQTSFLPPARVRHYRGADLPPDRVRAARVGTGRQDSTLATRRAQGRVSATPSLPRIPTPATSTTSRPCSARSRRTSSGTRRLDPPAALFFSVCGVERVGQAAAAKRGASTACWRVHAELDHVEERLQHRLQDHVAPRVTERQIRPSS